MFSQEKTAFETKEKRQKTYNKYGNLVNLTINAIKSKRLSFKLSLFLIAFCMVWLIHN